jgi:transcriptional regulator
MADLSNRTIAVAIIIKSFLVNINKSYNTLELFEGCNIDKQPMK